MLKFTKLLLWGLILCIASACSDDDKTDNSDAPKLTTPLPDVSTPQTAGSTVTITGTGFKDDCEVHLTEVAQTRWSARVFIPIITKRSETSISFIIPEGADGTFNVTIKQDGKEFLIGKIALKSNLTGIWQWVRSISGGITEEQHNQYFVIQADGNGYHSNNGERNKFTWSIDGKKITILYTEQEKLEVSIEDITATTLKVEYKEGSKTWQEELIRVEDIAGGDIEEPGEEESKENKATTLDYSNVILKEATCSGQYLSEDKNAVYGICYGTTDNPNIETKAIAASNADNSGKYSVKLNELTPNTTYHYRAYLTVKDTTYYGEALSFKTMAINTIGYKDEDKNTTFTGQYIKEKQELSEYGICYSTENQTPTTEDTKVSASNANAEGTFSITVNDLKTDKKYYYRAYIIFNGTTYYGEVLIWERNLLVGKWKMTLQEDVYTLTSTGETSVSKCTHPGTMEFKTDGTGIQTGIHYGDLGDADSDVDWHQEAIINYHWTKQDKTVSIIVDSSNIPSSEEMFKALQATISSLTDTELIFTYPIGTISEETASRKCRYTRISK